MLFFIELIVTGVLVRGDFFIVDNAPIHYSEEIAAALDAIETVSGVRCTLMALCSMIYSVFGVDTTGFFCQRILLNSTHANYSLASSSDGCAPTLVAATS